MFLFQGFLSSVVFCCFGFSVFAFAAPVRSQFSFSSQMKLKDLPDRTRVQIPKMIPVSLDIYENGYFLFYTHFDNRVIFRNLSVGSIFNHLDSGVTIQTDNIGVIHDRIVNGLILRDRVFFMKSGTYCINKGMSKFQSSTLNILSLYDCNNGRYQFNLYVNAGWKLRNQSCFHGLTVRDLRDQVGDYVKILL
jgi:hypothetical protein